MKYLLIFAIVIVPHVKAMEEPSWDIEKMATRIANQRRADDKAFIKEIQAIAKKSSKNLTHEDEVKLRDLAWNHENFCILEALCQSPLFKEKEMQRIKDLMLYDAIKEVTVGLHNSPRRARVLKNVEVLLKSGAAQHEALFKAVSLGYPVFRPCGMTSKDFEVGRITTEDHLKLVGLFAKYVKHDTFKAALADELRNSDKRDSALKIAQVAIQNGMDSDWINAKVKNR